MPARLLDLFRRQGRGQGVREEYVPWHQVTRTDPSSNGRSQRHSWGGRRLHLMSDLELTGFYFASQLKGLVDVREAFPLELDTAAHELAAYEPSHLGLRCHGTLQLAKELRVRHPMVEDGGIPKPLTTSQLLTLRSEDGHRALLAVTYRTHAPGRRGGALAVEAAYWAHRDVKWLLVTERQFDPEVALTLRSSACWALALAAPDDARRQAIDIAHQCRGQALSAVLGEIARAVGDLEVAQRSLWQTAWLGHIPLDMRRGWRPHLPLMLLRPAEWLAQNPLASGRSAWI